MTHAFNLFPLHFPSFLNIGTRKVYAVRINTMEKKINPFNYLHSDIQFGELLPHLLSSLFVSPSFLKVARVCVCVCVCVNIFPLYSLHLSKSCSYQTSKRLKHIYGSRKMMTTEFMPEHTPVSLRVQTDIYTEQNYSKGFESFNFLQVTLYRIWKVNKCVQHTYRTWFLCMRRI